MEVDEMDMKYLLAQRKEVKAGAVGMTLHLARREEIESHVFDQPEDVVIIGGLTYDRGEVEAVLGAEKMQSGCCDAAGRVLKSETAEGEVEP
jgi:hypothetical protein